MMRTAKSKIALEEQSNLCKGIQKLRLEPLSQVQCICVIMKLT